MPLLLLLSPEIVLRLWDCSKWKEASMEPCLATIELSRRRWLDIHLFANDDIKLSLNSHLIVIQ